MVKAATNNVKSIVKLGKNIEIGNDLQTGVIKNDYTPGIKKGRNHKEVSSFFVLKKNTDCRSFKAMSFPSKVFGEKWGGRRGKEFSKGPKYRKTEVDFVISDEKMQFKSKALLEVMSCSRVG